MFVAKVEADKDNKNNNDNKNNKLHISLFATPGSSIET